MTRGPLLVSRTRVVLECLYPKEYAVGREKLVSIVHMFFSLCLKVFKEVATVPTLWLGP